MSLILAATLALSGLATWYDDGPGLYAAVPSYSFGDARYPVEVCLRDQPSRCVTVTVRDHCNCHVGTSIEKTIDLSPQAFARLAPLGRGVVHVTVHRAGGAPTPPPAPKPVPNPTPPPTDTQDPAGVVFLWYWISTMVATWLARMAT